MIGPKGRGRSGPGEVRIQSDGLKPVATGKRKNAGAGRDLEVFMWSRALARDFEVAAAPLPSRVRQA